MQKGNFDVALRELEMGGFKELADLFRQETKMIPKSAPGAEIALSAQQVINDSGYLIPNEFSKAYLTTTQNLSYLNTMVSKDAKSAFVIMGGGDTILEMLARNVLDITAADINPMQSLVYHIKMASLRTLSHNDFKNFILKSNGNGFLDPNMFKAVSKGFLAEEYKGAWDILMDLNTPEEIKNGLFKRVEGLGGNYDRLKMSLSYLDRDAYRRVQENAEKANITLVSEDALTYLQKRQSLAFDYIDLTNVVSAFNLNPDKDDKEVLLERLATLIDIWENNLASGGTLVFDYQFGIVPSEYDTAKVSGPVLSKDVYAKTIMIYKEVYNYLVERFTIEYMTLPRVISGFSGKKDTVIYARK